MVDDALRARKGGRIQEMSPTKWSFLVVAYLVVTLTLLLLFMALTWGLGLILLLEFPLEAIILAAVLAFPFTLYLWWTSRRDYLQGTR